MKARLIRVILVPALLGLYAALCYVAGQRSTATERDALRATVSALREGDGSCAVTRDGPRVVCWVEHESVKVLPLKAGDVIVNRDCLEKKRRLQCAR